MQTIQFIKSHPLARVPTQGTPASAGFDLYAAEIEVKSPVCVSVNTGLNVAFAEDHVLLVFARSGNAMRHGIRLINGVAVIDADYRGSLIVNLESPIHTPDNLAMLINVGDRIAQAILVPRPQVTWVEVGQLPDTIRGSGGFGSTGIR